MLQFNQIIAVYVMMDSLLIVQLIFVIIEQIAQFVQLVIHLVKRAKIMGLIVIFYLIFFFKFQNSYI